MYPVIHECPVCKENLFVSRLHCGQCETVIEGEFTLGKFDNLSPEQLRFAETFIRCEGKINRVEEELEISYPTVRGKLIELIQAMGYKVKEEEAVPPPQPVDRKTILDQLASGQLTADEATRKLVGQ